MNNIKKSVDKNENVCFLTEQIITYLGNKRTLLDFIGNAVRVVQKELGREKLDIVDIFSGSGVVSRYFKQYANNLYVNDLEKYCYVINKCYLTNKSKVDIEKLNEYYRHIKNRLKEPLQEGFITRLYSPADDNNIQQGERVFYTHKNALLIDNIRRIIDEIPEDYKQYFLAPLLYEASVHNNTSGVFKGFYKNSNTGIGQFGGNGKNALTRILGDVDLKLPIFSDFECDVHIFNEDSNLLAKKLPPVDIVYIDPPYNQHPYGSNYFMLNLICENKEPKNISKVSGIPVDWNKSAYNKKAEIKKQLIDLCDSLDSKYILISFNSDGFISQEEMVELLSKYGEVRVFDKDYNTFRGCRNLNDRDIHIKEFLYLVNTKK